jgi:hypothetical protein
MAHFRLCTLLDVKDVAVLPTDAYPRILTLKLNNDPT